MTEFDLHNPIWVSPEVAQSVIGNAWLAQFRRGGWVSTIISRATFGPHSHTAMFRRNNGTVDVLEMVQFLGGRSVPFEHLLSRRGIVDVFSPCRDGIYAEQFDAKSCVEVMRQLTKYEYGWKNLGKMILRAIPGLWRLVPIETRDSYPCWNEGPPFCSQAAAIAYQWGGRVDPVPRVPPYYVTPNHLTWSMFFEYEFSLATPWTARKNWTREDNVATTVETWIEAKHRLQTQCF